VVVEKHATNNIVFGLGLVLVLLPADEIGSKVEDLFVWLLDDTSAQYTGLEICSCP